MMLVAVRWILLEISGVNKREAGSLQRTLNCPYSWSSSGRKGTVFHFVLGCTCPTAKAHPLRKGFCTFSCSYQVH